MSDVSLLSAVVFLPALGALLLQFVDKKAEDAMRFLTLAICAIVFGLTVVVAFKFDPSQSGMQMYVANVPWIESWNVYYRLGVDGMSMPLLLLSSFVSLLSMMASWGIKQHVKGYLTLFLLLETGMLGVFVALDFFLFYVFYEVMLLPMYFLIGIWGGPRREYAAIKFFIYTLVGSVLMLIALLMLYFGSGETRTFDLLRLAEIGQGRVPGVRFSEFVQMTAFTLLFIAFAIKVPVFPFHTWLPDAHVEAPTPISMILAGVLLKIGGYGILRVAFPICPVGAQYAAYVLVVLGVFSIIYGAFAALAQTDFKRLVAYSSVSHMGYVLLGISVWKIGEDGTTMSRDLWQMGMNAAMFQMIAHGITSPGMFFIVGVIYDRVHHRDLNKFGGLIGLMPFYGALGVALFFAGMGLPGMCGFIGEFFTVMSCWQYSPLLAIIAASGVIVTAGYILWAVQRVFLGAEYVGPHKEDITPLTPREATIGVLLLGFSILFGVRPDLIFGMMSATMNELVNQMANGYAAGAASTVAQVLGG